MYGFLFAQGKGEPNFSNVTESPAFLSLDLPGQEAGTCPFLYNPVSAVKFLPNQDSLLLRLVLGLTPNGMAAT